ncbi:MAG: WG repeat-containing protein [Azoarcus sp.]|nr:WG repeat-containing protein [Azoarcus sp.]
MKYRLPILILVILVTSAIIMLWVLPKIETGSISVPLANVSCKKVKQCLEAQSAWPPGMEYCQSILAPLAVRERSQNGTWGYSINYGECSKETIVSPRFDVAGKFGSNGLAKVSRNNKWGYVNLKDKDVVQLDFDEVGDFNGEQVPVKLKGKWGYANAQGLITLRPEFDAVSGIWGSGLSAVQFNGKWGYVDVAGKIIITPTFDKATKFNHEGLAKVEVNRKWGVIDTQGNFIIPAKFDLVLATVNPHLLLVAQNQKYGYFDDKGKEIIPPRLIKPVQTKYDKKGIIQVLLNDTVLTDEHADGTEPPIRNNAGWFYLDSPDEKLRFDEKGKVQIWHNGEWFYINNARQLLKPTAINNS